MPTHEKPSLRPLEDQVIDEFGPDFDGQGLILYSDLLLAHYPEHEIGILRAIEIYLKYCVKEEDKDGVLCVFHSIEDGTRNPLVQNNEIL